MKERLKNMSSTAQTSNSGSTTSTSNNNDTIDSNISHYNFGAPTIGSIVKCTMCLGNSIQGKVIAYDLNTKMLALRTSLNGKQNWDVSLVNLDWCSNLTVVEEANEPPETLQSLNIQKINQRMQKNIEKKWKEISALGDGVTNLAQNLYFTIYKTLDHVKWDNKKIVVMDSVIIEPPYEVGNCYSDTNNSQALEHIRKIVSKFHEDYKIQQQTIKPAENETQQSLENSANVSCNSFASPSSPPPSSCSSVSSTNNEK